MKFESKSLETFSHVFLERITKNIGNIENVTISSNNGR